MRHAIPVILAAVLLAGHATAQDTGLVVGSGNFFSPIVANLERAVAFYHDGLGLDVMGAPSNAAENAPLRNMFGLPGAQLRWTVARPAGLRQGVEIVEISQADGRPLDRRLTDPGAMTLVVSTADDLDAVAGRLKAHGGTLISQSPKGNVTGDRALVMRTPDDHFVEVIANDSAPLPLPRVRLTVNDLQKSAALYRDALGLQSNRARPVTNNQLMTVLGADKPGPSVLVLEVPGSGLMIELVQFRANSRTVAGRIQDPGSTRLQLQVRNLDAAVQAIVRAGGHVVSTGGRPVDMPAGRGGSIRAAIVQDPDHLFVVLIEAAQPRP